MDGKLKIPFFRLGSWKHPVYGKIEGTQQLFNQFMSNMKANVLGRPAFIRIGHDKGNKQMFGDTPAEGWIEDIVQDGDVLYAIAKPTNDQVALDIKNKRYRFASAEYEPNYIDKETGLPRGAVLSAVSLTNEPFLTKLPEAVVLADEDGSFYLDYEEVKPIMDKEFLKKLAAPFNAFASWLAGGAEGEPPAITQSGAQSQPLTTPTAVPAVASAINLSDHPEFKALQDKIQKLSEQNDSLVDQNRQKDIEALAQGWLNQGIPPAVVNHAKQLLASSQSQATIKLADEQGQMRDVSGADLIKQMVEAYPADKRIKFGQQGSATIMTPSAEAHQQIVQLSEETIKALGGKVEDGKFII